ncbi:MAG: hypothetical protein EOO15_11900 [Chitinophagaceae bacterium]|nr:MAG: hypothetical protein EOO15_11900 [Chitinophagaceae bacterium]
MVRVLIALGLLVAYAGYSPDLTTAWSDPKRGPAYLRALLQSGGSRMPNFHFTKNEVASLLAYLRSVDASTHEYAAQP